MSVLVAERLDRVIRSNGLSYFVADVFDSREQAYFIYDNDSFIGAIFAHNVTKVVLEYSTAKLFTSLHSLSGESQNG